MNVFGGQADDESQPREPAATSADSADPPELPGRAGPVGPAGPVGEAWPAGALGAGDLQIVRQLAGVLAGLLGPGWQVQPESPFPGAVVVVTGPDRTRLLLALLGTRHERVSVSGLFPYPLPHHVQRPGRVRITVARDRGPEVLAREIRWRLLPAYRKALTQLHTDLRQDAHDRQRQARLVDELTAILARAYQYRHDTHEGTDLVVGLPGRGQGRIRVDRTGRSGEVRLTQLPAEALAAITRALTGNR